MSLGWGKVPIKDWNKLASGGRADPMDAGDYFGTPNELVHFDPSKNDKGLGTYIVRFETTQDNPDEEARGKCLEMRCMYHPDPASSSNEDGYAQMNNISLGKLASLVEALGATPVVDEGTGEADVIASVEAVINSGGVVLGTVSHEVYEGKRMQTYDGFRSIG